MIEKLNDLTDGLESRLQPAKRTTGEKGWLAGKSNARMANLENQTGK